MNDKINSNDTSQNGIDRFTTSFSTSTFEWTESIAQALVVMVAVLAFIFRIATVDGTSMLNTLHDKDKVFILKWNYTPRSGDVVVITKGVQYDKPLVKRAIATEGQTLSIDFDNNTVIVDGTTLKEPYILEPMWRKGDGVIPKVIPKGHTFVMGDNRNNSMDSRYKEIGVIPNENIVGKATHIVFPLFRFGAIK
ncbi:MAG: signal peptidase I [Oscillospiraceae bacterium]|jgi:signal peptidase I|nr:signal peptidase I [Oscillospiraceae bacterium]